MAFGLGAGPCFYYVTLEEASPTRWFNGRTARLEENFSELTGSALELRTFEEGDGEAWEAARAAVDAGSPALLLTDIYHLDHYGDSARFPGHAVVLAGYDDEVAHLSDTGFEELQTTALENLDRARHGDHPAYPLAGHMFTTSEAIDAARLHEAIPAAIERAATAMTEPEFREFSGLDAVHRLAAEAGSWPEAAEDWKWCARFGYQVIERRGTGGGCFRLMYSRFLEEAGRAEAPLAAEAAARWTELAARLPDRERSRGRPSRISGPRSTPPPGASAQPRTSSGRPSRALLNNLCRPPLGTFVCRAFETAQQIRPEAV